MGTHTSVQMQVVKLSSVPKAQRVLCVRQEGWALSQPFPRLGRRIKDDLNSSRAQRQHFFDSCRFLTPGGG